MKSIAANRTPFLAYADQGLNDQLHEASAVIDCLASLIGAQDDLHCLGHNGTQGLATILRAIRNVCEHAAETYERERADDGAHA